MGDLHAHGRGQAIAHRAKPAGCHPMVRLLEAEMLRGPHLMLAHFGGDEHFRPHSRVSSYSRRIACCGLMIAPRRGPGVAQALPAPPGVDVAPPFRQRRGVLFRRVRFQASSSASSARPASPTIAISTGHILVDAGGVDVGWIFRASGQKAVSRPVTRSSKRAPIASRRRSRTWRDWPRRCRACRACRGTAGPSGTGAEPHQRTGAGKAGARTTGSASDAAGPALITPPPV